ncbi:hypothetical protein [Streptomyces viridochromogenes]|uniref:hypothetical protein n=1 Tax=Streptomyces viridochromogenes TaxID=1938 RepID=UPI001319D781|nr:hypothetical protein [Streptomyces viridochromogenes]
MVAVVVAGCGGGSEEPSPPSSPPSTEPSDEITDPPPPPEPTDDITERPSPTAPETPPSATFEAPQGFVPSELVGEWDGDGTSVRFDKIRFSDDGGVRLLYNSGLVLDGTAVVEGTSMTLYVPGGPIPYAHWSIEQFDAGYGYVFENLKLDGSSYVRQIAGG